MSFITLVRHGQANSSARDEVPVRAKDNSNAPGGWMERAVTDRE